MKPTRSLLFVPGHREGWASKAAASGADAVILDLEDSVPAEMKERARRLVSETVAELARDHPALGIYVRPNAMETGLMGDDLEAVAIDGCTGLLLPKLYNPRDVISAEALAGHFERRNGVTRGPLEFILTLETAQSYAECDRILAASPRCATLFASTARDGDVSRSVGFEFSAKGDETLYLRSRAVLATRAGGRDFPLVGLWQDIHDLDGAREFALANKRLGFRGLVVIHPSHVAIANEVFMPSDSELSFYLGMIEAFETGLENGRASVAYEGMHIDLAHVKTARDVIAMHEALSSRSR